MFSLLLSYYLELSWLQDQDDECYFAAGNKTTSNNCIHAGDQFSDTFSDHFCSYVYTMPFNPIQQFCQEFYFNKALLFKIFVDTVREVIILLFFIY